MLAFGHLVGTVFVEFRRIQSVEGLQRQIAAGLVFAGVGFCRNRSQRLALPHRYRSGKRVFEGQAFVLYGGCVFAVLGPSQVVVGIAGVGTVTFGLGLRVWPNHRRSLLRLICFITPLAASERGPCVLENEHAVLLQFSVLLRRRHADVDVGRDAHFSKADSKRTLRPVPT